MNTSWKDDDRWIVWCGLNNEQAALEAAFGDLCFSVYGTLEAEEKTRRIFAWLRGERPILVTKVSMCGFGLNLQCCNKMVFVGLNDSFEQTYQAIRRCWRFGQTRPVNVYVIASELEGAVVANIEAKERAFEAMGAAMAEQMIGLTRRTIRTGRVATSVYRPTKTMEVPQWMGA